MSTLFRVQQWRHNPDRRKSRFRCQECQKVIADGGDVVIERRGKGSHGYHAACFEAAVSGADELSSARAAFERSRRP